MDSVIALHQKYIKLNLFSLLFGYEQNKWANKMNAFL